MLELDGLQSALTKIPNLQGTPKQAPSIDALKVAALHSQYILRGFFDELKKYEGKILFFYPLLNGEL